jgi:hypothetical protein
MVRDNYECATEQLEVPQSAQICSYTYSLVAYLTTRSVVQTKQHQMADYLETIGNGAVVV